ncbi:hypothetical protein [Campylobacter curvus]|uniref:hypothetical protein n=1 Tax=Campylobacter curvus TaxID=200 RepID=UPI00146FC94E|nr:hypothetical protein [Campylobacter curvus]
MSIGARIAFVADHSFCEIKSLKERRAKLAESIGVDERDIEATGRELALRYVISVLVKKIDELHEAISQTADDEN